MINDVGALTPTGLAAATALMLLFAVINVLGVRWLAECNRIAVLWKVAVPVLTVVVLIVVSFQASNFTAAGGLCPTVPMGCLRLYRWVSCSRCRALNKRRRWRVRHVTRNVMCLAR